MQDLSLYDRLGGRDAIMAAVDLFYDKIEADNRVNHLFRHMDMTRLRSKQKMYLCYAFGGAPGYSGRTLRESHANMNLTDADFDAVAENLKNTLEELGVDPDLIAESLAIVETTRADVLNL